MSIIFHCNHCGKKIEAPDHTGGKWAKCPACHNKIYIPEPHQAEDELRLAPIDETEEMEKKRLLAETFKLTQDILQEKENPSTAPAFGGQLSQAGKKELTKNIIIYLRLMANGDLDQANNVADKIAPFGQHARDIIDRIGLSEIPEPELADIPRQVLSGFIRNLRSRLS